MNANSQLIIADDYLHKLDGSLVVIDCGHLPVLVSEEGLFQFGKEGEPSVTEIFTLALGVDVYKRLKKFGREAKLSICFSDTTRYFKYPEKRPLLKEMCETGEVVSILPISYQEIVREVDPADYFFSLQTVNSNRFTKIIKKVKKDIRTINDEQKVFDIYNVLFAKDNLDILFSFTNSFLLDVSNENKALDGSWWLDEFSTLHPTDLVKAPVASLKKFGIISLYSKKTGILCPATYGGLISYFGDGVDHVAIYSRNDDPSIGEKIIRGIVSITTLSQPQLVKKNFLQVILNSNFSEKNLKSVEISCLSCEDVNVKGMNFKTLDSEFSQKLSFRYKKFI